MPLAVGCGQISVHCDIYLVFIMLGKQDMAKKTRRSRGKRGFEEEDTKDLVKMEDGDVKDNDGGKAKKGKNCNHDVKGLNDIVRDRKKYVCGDCGSRARWMCLSCRTALCAKGDDHMSSHFQETGHSLYANVGNGRILCQSCEEEVEPEMDNKQSMENECLPSASHSYNTEVAIPPSKATKRYSTLSTRGNPVESYALNSRPIMSAIEDEDDDVKPKGLCGLYNLGNTCYANAALQALNNCPPFSDYFRRKASLAPYASSGGYSQPLVAQAFAQLVQNMWSPQRVSAIHPGNLLYQIRSKCPQFSGFSQQDSQELIRCVLELVHRELARPVYAHEEAAASEWRRRAEEKEEKKEGGNIKGHRRSSVESGENAGDSGWSSDGDGLSVQEGEIDWRATKHRSIVSDVFDGTMESAVRCLTCNNVSTTTETFEDLSLQIASPPQNVEEEREDESWMWRWLHWFGSWPSWLVSPSVSLEECFGAFFTPDRLIGDDMYSCEKCKKLRNGVKSYRITRLPEVLCVHLKRFHHDHLSACKVSTRVTFPLSGLNLSSWATETAGETEYELCALVCHEGSSVDSGHYVAVARNEIDGNWYEFDDSTVTKLDAGYVLTKDAYVLFYQKKQGRKAEDRRERVRQLMSTQYIANTNSSSRHYISSEWLERLSTFADPGPITNFDFLCPHGNLLPRRAEYVNVICTSVPTTLWRYLTQTFGGGPAVSALHYCAVCEKRAQSMEEKRKREKELFRRIESRIQTEERLDPSLLYSAYIPLVCLSRTWFQSWERFLLDPSAEPPSAMDNSHLLVKMSDGKMKLRPRPNCLPVPREVYLFFQELYGGSPEVVLVEGPQPTESEWAEAVRKADRGIAAARERLREYAERKRNDEEETESNEEMKEDTQLQ